MSSTGPNQPLHSGVAGAACVTCESLSPCCVRELRLGCDHGTNRHIIDGFKKPHVIALVADKGTPDHPYDILKAEVGHKTRPNCTTGAPRLKLTGKGVDEVSQKIDEKLFYPVDTDGIDTFSNLEKLGYFLKNMIWDGGIESSAEKYQLNVLSCVQFGFFDSSVLLYPPVEWEAKGFIFGFSGTYYTNGKFKLGAEFGGELSGKYAGTSLSIGAKVETDNEAKKHSKSTVPFLDKLVGALSNKSEAENSKNSTYSYVKIEHKQDWGSSKLTLSENAKEPFKVGYEAEITLGFDPMFSLTLHLDILDAVLRAAQKYPPAAPFATALAEAREKGAEGYKNKTLDADGNPTVEASFHAAVYLKAKGVLGKAGLTLKRSPGDEKWDSSFIGAESSIELTLGVEVKAKAKVYFVEGTLTLEGKATAKLILGVKTIPENEKKGNEVMKMKLEHNGVKLKYKGEARASISKSVSTGAAKDGEVIVFEKDVWGEWTY